MTAYWVTFQLWKFLHSLVSNFHLSKVSPPCWSMKQIFLKGEGPKTTKKKSCSASYVLKCFEIQKETNVSMFYG